MFAQGQLKEDDYVAAQFLHLRPRPVFFVIGIILLVLYALVLVIALFNGFYDLLYSILLIGLGGFFLQFQSKRLFRQYKALSEPVTMEVREDGLFFKRTNGEGLVPWSHIHKWRNNKRLVLLYPAGNVFHMIPSHFFVDSDAFQAFISTLGTKLGNAT